jgi:hypothetical protein
MNLPAFPDGERGGHEHHNPSNGVHVQILSAPPAKRPAAASILNGKWLDRPCRPQSYDESERNTV